MEERLIELLQEYYDKIDPLTKKVNLSYFDASISGKESDYEKSAAYQIEISKYYSNKEMFRQLKKFKESDKIKNPVLKRELDLIYNEFAANQFDEKLHEEIINLSTKIEQKFSTYRPKVDGKQLTDNEIDEILEKSTDPKELEETWKASKEIGQIVADDVIKLVKLRNKGARELGYENYHEMSLILSEQNSEDLDKLFDELNELTEEGFGKLKKEMDNYLSIKLGIEESELMPWHYEDKFFQLGPKIYNVDLDKYYKDQNIAELTKKYFNGINLSIDDIIAKSDLYEKEGKYQHAYCMDIDRKGDVRVVCNIKPNQKWMSTMLHEFGHAVYDKLVSSKLPWQLRSHAHIFTTEAIAMMFGRFAQNPEWIFKMIGISEEEKNQINAECCNSLRLEQLTFSRWVQVMYRFEREMYSNPDQNLNYLWWKLVEEYQLLKKPEGRNEPDWASKIHVALYPAYYHNYILGELLASQLYVFITTKVLKSDKVKNESFVGRQDVGEYLGNLFFSYGALYPWNELIVKATGEELTAEYYAQQFLTKSFK